MPFIKKTTYMKHEGEYESPDGDRYDCAIVKHGDRCYVQWTKQDADRQVPACPIIIDGQMLEGLYEWYCEMTGKRTSAIRLGPGGRPGRLRAPNVVDHRGDPQGVEIHRSVKESMRNYDDSVLPVESFSPEVWDTPEGQAIVRSGVDVEAQGEVQETPEEWALRNNVENLPMWKKEALQRKSLPKPEYRDRGAVGKIVGNKPLFKRVGASEII